MTEVVGEGREAAAEGQGVEYSRACTASCSTQGPDYPQSFAYDLIKLYILWGLLWSVRGRAAGRGTWGLLETTRLQTRLESSDLKQAQLVVGGLR